MCERMPLSRSTARKSHDEGMKGALMALWTARNQPYYDFLNAQLLNRTDCLIELLDTGGAP